MSDRKAVLRRRRPSLPTVLSALALFVALGGTAIAASHYLITSTTQIKPNVLAKIERDIANKTRGPRGNAGQGGAPGPAGPTGAPGPAGADGLGTLEGFSASGGQVELVDEPNVMATAVSKRLPAGNFIANGSATVNVEAVEVNDWLVTCTLTDTPDSGQPTTDTVQWEANASWDMYSATPASAQNTLPFQEAIESPNSPSTLSIACEALGHSGMSPDYAPIGSVVASSLTAIQTSSNS